MNIFCSVLNKALNMHVTVRIKLFPTVCYTQLAFINSFPFTIFVYKQIK